MCAAKHCLPYIVNLGLPLGRTSSQRVHCVALLALEGLLAETPRVGGGVSPGPQEFTPSDCAGHLANQSMELTNSKGVGGEGEHSVPTLLSDYIVYIS